MQSNQLTDTYYPLSKEYMYDYNHKKFFYDSKQIKLTKKEILLIELLLKNSYRVVTYKELENNVWKEDVMTECAVRSLVRNLRKKIPCNLIENLSGVGYKLA